MELNPGDVYWAAPDATVGREQAGRRPVVVVANDAYLQTMDTLALVVPITSQNRGWLNHIELDNNTGLAQKSYAMTEQVRTISRARLQQKIGSITHQQLADIRDFITGFMA